MEDINQTFDALGLADSFMVNIHKLYPDTPFYQALKAKGEVDDDIWFDRSIVGPLYFCKENFSSATFTLEELKWFYLLAHYIHTKRRPELAEV